MALTGTDSAQGKILPTDSTDGTTCSSNGKEVDSIPKYVVEFIDKFCLQI